MASDPSAPRPNPSFLGFDDLIDRFFDLDGAEAELKRRYLTTAAVLVVDCSGMVKRTDADGITYALGLARKVEHAFRPGVEARHGEIVKRVADTFMAAFRTPEDALAATLAGHRAVREMNATRTGKLGDGTRNDPIHPCTGLGFGEVLLVPGEDIYGEEANRAFVLGEDIAQSDEVLCTLAFLAALGTPPVGVGTHRGPADKEAELGFPFHVVVDAG